MNRAIDLSHTPVDGERHLSTASVDDRGDAGQRPRVLHVTEALGGVPVSIQHFIDATPYADHYYAAMTLRQHPTTAVPTGVVDAVATQVTSPVRWRRAVRDHVDSWNPTHLHFHSSFAGLWGRLRRFGPQRVLYTPHCYAFERGDLSQPVRRTLRVMEAALERQTDVVAAISDREARLTHQLRRQVKAEVVTAFNPMGSTPKAPAHRAARSTVPVVGTMGRITAQKDPSFFLSVVEETRRQRPDLQLDWVWIGQGDATDEERLRAAGVRVTGWLPAQEAAAELDRIDVYTHTAAWEGFPLAVVEAITEGIPVSLRSVAALPSVLQTIGHESPAAMAADIISTVGRGPAPAYVAAISSVVEKHSPSELAAVCRDLYR